VSNSTDSKEDIWCRFCGDRTCYAVIEERTIDWFLKDVERGIGICMECSKVVDQDRLILPEEGEE